MPPAAAAEYEAAAAADAARGGSGATSTRRAACAPAAGLVPEDDMDADGLVAPGTATGVPGRGSPFRATFEALSPAQRAALIDQATFFGMDLRVAGEAVLGCGAASVTGRGAASQSSSIPANGLCGPDAAADGEAGAPPGSSSMASSSFGFDGDGDSSSMSAADGLGRQAAWSMSAARSSSLASASIESRSEMLGGAAGGSEAGRSATGTGASSLSGSHSYRGARSNASRKGTSELPDDLPDDLPDGLPPRQAGDHGTSPEGAGAPGSSSATSLPGAPALPAKAPPRPAALDTVSPPTQSQPLQPPSSSAAAWRRLASRLWHGLVRNLVLRTGAAVATSATHLAARFETIADVAASWGDAAADAAVTWLSARSSQLLGLLVGLLSALVQRSARALRPPLTAVVGVVLRVLKLVRRHRSGRHLSNGAGAVASMAIARSVGYRGPMLGALVYMPLEAAFVALNLTDLRYFVLALAVVLGALLRLYARLGFFD